MTDPQFGRELPLFEAGFEACSVLHRNFICFTDKHERILMVLDPGLHAKTAVVEHYDEIVKQPTQVEKYRSFSIIVLARLDEVSQMQQGRVAKWLLQLARNHSDLVCIGTIKRAAGLSGFLKSCFWFATQGPQGDIVGNKITGKSPNNVSVHVALKRYILDIIIHIRMHRLVVTAKGGGAGMNSLQDIIDLSQWMVAKNASSRKQFVTPDVIQQASVWYFPLHMELLKEPFHDSSVLYASDVKLVEELINQLKKLALRVGRDNPLMLEIIVVKDVLSKVVPAI
ncbi:HBL030Wp [Eremothecium sinecaudum]|uniref:HBL030Wp n=1 Tax=Eremothecium sinecaudum TaxID=45286 RepID=A0A120K103_9SACH|nr:HBL030Wp [Eremothecium sinecaudum]AMD18872.1 HBL030Wp [Eremothecium sinecaudum]